MLSDNAITMSKLKPYQNALMLSQFISSQSLGRRYSIEKDDIDACYFGALDPFFIDKEKLRLSHFLQRLSGVGQVFTSSTKSNRLIHTEEVVSIATKIGKILGLNIHLIEAISLLHDFGHPFFSHQGERIISQIAGKDFRHEVMSLVIAQKITRRGQGLNLSYEVLEGALNHSRANGSLQANPDKPLEYGVVAIADKLACVFSDLEEALRRGHFDRMNLPTELFALGHNHSTRIFNCIAALVKESAEKQLISFVDSEIAEIFEALRQWNYKNFYYALNNSSERKNLEVDFEKAYPFLSEIFSDLGYNPLLIFALMTDKEVIRINKAANNNRALIFKKNFLLQFPAMEIIVSIPRSEKINLFNADLDKSKFQQFDHVANFDFPGD